MTFDSSEEENDQHNLPPSKDTEIEQNGPAKKASFRFDVSKIELSQLKQPLIELEANGQDIEVRPTEVEAINDLWNQITDNITGSSYKIRKDKYFVYKVDTGLLNGFDEALRGFKEGSGLEQYVTPVLDAIYLNFFKLRGNSYERINLGRDNG